MNIDVGTRMYWVASPKLVYVVISIVPSTRREDDLLTIDGDNLTKTVSYRRHRLYSIIETGYAKLVSADAITTQPSDDCPECWGTGYYKGYGVVCSEGCHAPAGAKS